MKRYTIWSAFPNFADWEDDLREDYPGAAEYELHDKMHERNAEYLDDERDNLSVAMDAPIIRIDDIGRWNGRFAGSGIIKSGIIADCLQSNLMPTWYVDELGDLRCEAAHHDATNYYLYRVFKPGVTAEQMEALQEKVCEGRVTRKDITRLTSRLGDAIANVYGWTDLPARGRGPLGRRAFLRR